MFKQITLSVSLLSCLFCNAANPEKNTPRTQRKDTMQTALSKEEQVCRKNPNTKTSNFHVIPEINGGIKPNTLKGCTAAKALALLEGGYKSE